ncbi:hypothetical protein AKJ56_00625 [candidate division MSBL1 archaeon SCGC-AAA382N08]|uniref:Uncharacterized protein n=1 Tax=candidate division MSBL1 archaeon SCGC-AAA382N08 TaxID=1698285 RepID=A0A133VQB6_9EURY|nr:hypothetical protein AKJ56_00625 [candidate division MSBL1 archaeon SCGC-AAA382N08]
MVLVILNIRLLNRKNRDMELFLWLRMKLELSVLLGDRVSELVYRIADVDVETSNESATDTVNGDRSESSDYLLFFSQLWILFSYGLFRVWLTLLVKKTVSSKFRSYIAEICNYCNF